MAQEFFVFDISYVDRVDSFDVFVDNIIGQIEKGLHIQSLLFTFEGLNDWMDQTTIVEEIVDAGFSISANHKNYDKFTFYDYTNEISFTNNITTSIFNSSLTEQKGWLCLPLKDNTVSLKSAINSAKHFKALISFLVNEYLKFTSIHFDLLIGISSNKNSESDNEEKLFYTIPGSYFFIEVGKVITRSKKYPNSFSSIKDHLQTMMDRWLSDNERFQFIVSNYLGELKLQGFLEEKILNSIRNLEVYHRNFCEKDKEKDIDLKEALQELSEYIDSKYEEDLAKKIFIFPKEITLRERLKDFFRGLPNEIQQLLFHEETSIAKSIRTLANRLVETRNYYTHGDDFQKYPNKISDYDEMFLIDLKLKLILRYYIFLELGLSSDLTLDLLDHDINRLRKLI